MVALSPVHLASLAATIVAILAITAWSARSVKSAEGFSLCGRSSGAVMVAGAIMGTCVGGASTIGTAQLAFSVGLSAWWFSLGLGLGLVLMAVFYAAPLRRAGLETVPEYLGIHFGRVAAPLVSVISSLGIVFSIVASTLSGVVLIELICRLNHWEAGGAIVLFVIPCVLFGGLKGAGVSGLLKMAVLWLAMIVAGVVACIGLAGLPDFAATFPARPWLTLFGMMNWDLAGNVASLMVGMMCTQTYIQAVYSATNSRAAVIGALAAAAISIPVGLPAIAVGMFMRAAHPDMLPLMALPAFLVLYVPAWFGGIALGGILFSIIGSIAGLALGVGTMMAHDIGVGVLGVKDSRVELLLNRLGVVTITCVGVAIAVINVDTFILDWNYMSMTFRAAGVFVPLTVAIFWPHRLSGGWAVSSMAVSTAAAVIGRFVLRLPVNPLFVGLAVSLAMVVAGLALSGRPAGKGAARAAT
jgi:solute:Na+ symporter, SSS family